MSSSTHSDKEHEIEFIVQELLQLRQDGRVTEADRLKRMLLNQHSVEVFYRRNGTIGWSKAGKNAKPTEKRVVWSMVDVRNNIRASLSGRDVPLVIATVNTPYYRSRLAKTMEFLSDVSFDDGTRFQPIKAVDMLNLTDHPSIGVNRIVFEGWRQILLPTISSPTFTRVGQSVVFVAEDDLRLCGVSPGRIRDACAAVFVGNPDIHVLSLGHAYSPTKPSRRQRRRAKRHNPNNGLSERDVKDDATRHVPKSSLLQHVNSGKGLHGATLLALRHPQGTKSLIDAMDNLSPGKRCHFDQFLFQSTLHNIEITLSDPPLVGWAEVSETLTSVGSGCRRYGGGRLEYLPEEVACGDVKWVRRSISNNVTTSKYQGHG